MNDLAKKWMTEQIANKFYYLYRQAESSKTRLQRAREVVESELKETAEIEALANALWETIDSIEVPREEVQKLIESEADRWAKAHPNQQLGQFRADNFMPSHTGRSEQSA